MEKNSAQTSLNPAIVLREFPPGHATTYLNTGSSGRKPASVLQAMARSWNAFNDNPTFTTFLDPSPMENARAAIAQAHAVQATSVCLVQNPSQGLHLLMQSFLRKAGDELLTTDHEHGSVYTIARHLEETRGTATRRFTVDPSFGSAEFCLAMIEQVTERTKLVVVSEIACTTGWRPDLSSLVEALSMLDVPLIVDGAHVTGHVRSQPSKFPMWVGSGHKWLGGPGGTGFMCVAPHLVPLLEPVWLGDKYYERKDADIESLARFESMGTNDVVKWIGLTRAFELYNELGPDLIIERQNALVTHLRQRLDEKLKPIYRTPLESETDSQSAILTFYFPSERLAVNNIATALWEQHQIFARDDFFGANPNAGLRVSCHYSVTESDIDALVDGLSLMVERA